jgi:hypothetical protein
VVSKSLVILYVYRAAYVILDRSSLVQTLPNFGFTLWNPPPACSLALLIINGLWFAPAPCFEPAGPTRGRCRSVDAKSSDVSTRDGPSRPIHRVVGRKFGKFSHSSIDFTNATIRHGDRHYSVRRLNPMPIISISGERDLTDLLRACGFGNEGS